MDLAALVDACRSLDADVLALQEVDRIGGPRHGLSHARLVAEALGMAWVFAPARRRDRVTSGNGLLVRGSIGAVERIALRGQLRRGLRDQRGAIVAQASARGQAISVAVDDERWRVVVRRMVGGRNLLADFLAAFFVVDALERLRAGVELSLSLIHI